MTLTQSDYREALMMDGASNMGAIARWLLERLPAIGNDPDVEYALRLLISQLSGHVNEERVYLAVGLLFDFAYGKDHERRRVAEHPIARLAIQVIGNILGRPPYWVPPLDMYSDAVYGAKLAIHLAADGIVSADGQSAVVLTLVGKPDIQQKSHAWHYLRAYARRDYFEYEFNWVDDDAVQLIGRYYV